MGFERSSGFSGCFAFGDFSCEVCLGVGVTALFDNRDAVERSVELSVATSVQAVVSAYESGVVSPGSAVDS